MEDPVSRAPVRRGIYLLPNLITTGALFAGFYAIVAAIDGNFERAGVAVFVAMVFDGLDGRVARWTSTESAFGKEYDSLSDMVSFGLAPAIVTYQWGVARITEYGAVWGRTGWLAAFFFAVAAGLRLARFNTRATVDKRFFEGLPSPSAAAVVAAFVWFSSEWREPGLVGLIVAFVVTALAGALMVSRFSYYSFKEINPGGRIPFAYIALVPLTFVLIAIKPPVVLFTLFSMYALSGPVWWLFGGRRSANAVQALPPPDSDDTDVRQG
ncbi:MAG TPA: CDP-diacylglycerol--serine O-phosphatidyltransferase [Steroidobacteraceae bacterium]|nr:CDP-diacylglycerol--serine O-phosphatidyltransferase [Steroidobacteraceae bacterium]